jgi:hypothetical protein
MMGQAVIRRRRTNILFVGRRPSLGSHAFTRYASAGGSDPTPLAVAIPSRSSTVLQTVNAAAESLKVTRDRFLVHLHWADGG